MAVHPRRPRHLLMRARLRHAAGRSGRTRCSRRRWQDRARSPQRVDEVVVLADGARRGRAARELPRADVPRAPEGRPRGFASRRALARELRGLRGRRRHRAHVPDLRRARRAARAAARRIRLSLWFTHWRASRLLATAERLVDDRRRASTGARSRSSRRRCARSGTASTSSEFPCVDASSGASGLRLLALGRYSPAKGLDDDRARPSGGSTASDWSCTGRRSTARGAAHRDELERLVRELALDGASARGAGAARRRSRPVRGGGRARQQHARRALRTRSSTRRPRRACP